jgi:hypothetical protein
LTVAISLALFIPFANLLVFYSWLKLKKMTRYDYMVHLRMFRKRSNDCVVPDSNLTTDIGGIGPHLIESSAPPLDHAGRHVVKTGDFSGYVRTEEYEDITRILPDLD